MGIDSLEFLEHVRTLDCVVYSCKEPTVPHHRKALGMGSKSRNKPVKEHLYAIPMCWIHHSQLHSYGEEKFEQTYGLNLAAQNLMNLVNWVFAYTGNAS